MGRVEEAVDFHAELIRDHNRLPHYAHHKRNDGKARTAGTARDGGPACATVPLLDGGGHIVASGVS